MHRQLIQRLHQLLSLLVIVSLLLPVGLVAAQDGGTETPAPTDTPAPEATATPTETPTEVPAETASEPAPTESTPVTPSRGGNADPRLSSALGDLAEAYQAGGAAAALGMAETQGLSLQASGENVQVVAMLAPGRTANEARDLIASLGGVVEVDIDSLVQISMPLNNLQALAASGVFAGVRLPVYAEEVATVTTEDTMTSLEVFTCKKPDGVTAQVPCLTEGKVASNADDWQAVGLTGKGVKVAILAKGFPGYTTLYGTELPPATRIHARSFRADGNLQIVSDGRQVAEIVYDMAPDAELWLVNFSTELEFVEAMDWLITQNVDIINASVGWTNYDDGDGDSITGINNALVDAVNRVNTAGILYVAAAGNSAVGHRQMAYSDFPATIPAITGSVANYHQWAVSDVFNELTNFVTTDITDDGVIDILGCPFGELCYVEVNLAWSDWTGTNGQDYDIYVLHSTDNGVNWIVDKSSTNDQANGYPWPTEFIGAYVPAAPPVEVLDSNGDSYDPKVYEGDPNYKVAIVVHRYNNTAGGDFLELYTNGGWQLQVSDPASSLLSPADAVNAFAVGAYNHYPPSSLEIYSSQGPVNEAGGAAPSGDEAVKPDITGPACVSTSVDIYGFDGDGFCDTSGAAPHVAGAAALVLQANPAFTNAQLRSFLETTAEADAGDPTPGQDNQWGWGKLTLGAAPAGPAACPTCINSAGWPLFQNGQPRTGLGASAVPTTATLLWTSPALTADIRSVVVGSGALAYVKAGRYVYGLNKDFGTTTWTFDLGALGVAKGPGAPALTDGGSPAVFVGSGDGYAYKIDANTGLQVCKSAKLGVDLSKASPMIGADGTVYFVDDTAAIDRLIAVNPDCSQKWAVNLGAGAGTSSPAYWANPADPNTTDDLIFVGADKLYAFTIWGGLKWSVSLKTAPEVTTTVPSTPIVVDPSGTWKVYAVNNVGDLYEVTNLTTTGTALRVADSPAGAHASGSLAAYKHNPTDFYLYWGHLATLWRYNTAGGAPSSLPLAGSLTDASPVVDSAGNVFIGSTDGKVYGVDADATPMVDLDGAGTAWPKIAAISTAGGLAILDGDDPDPNGELYVPSTDDRLRKYGALPGVCTDCNTDNGQWPTFQREVKRNGNGLPTVGASPVQLWNRAPGGDVFPPVVGETGLPGHAQGVTYFVTGRYLRALDIDTRNVIWSYDLGVAGTAAGFAAPALANQGSATGFGDGIVYVGGKDGFLHAVNALTGARLWATDVGLDISKASPLIDDNGVVYVVEDGAVDRLIAASHEGAVKWTASIGAAAGTSSPVFDAGTSCVFVGGNKLYGFNIADGTGCSGWAGGFALTLGPATTVPGAPMIVGTDVYALNSLGDLYRVSIDGTSGAVLEADAAVGAGAGSLAYDSANSLFYWTLGGKLQRWDGVAATPTAITGSTGTTANSTPVIDAAGHVFFGTSDNKLWRVSNGDTAATLIFTAAGSMASAGAITTDGTNGVLLWPSLDDKLYAFGTPEGNCPACDLGDTAYWPAFQRNPQHAPGEQGGGGANIRKTRQFTAAGATRPAVADANNIYFVAGQNLYARNKNTDAFAWGTVGGLEKKYNLGVAVTAGVFGMPALATDGANTILYIGGSDGNLHAVDAANGNLIWKTDVGNNISKASPIVSAGGFILVVEDNVAPAVDRLIALDSTGTVVWAQSIGNSNGTSSPAIDVKTPGIADDVVLVGGGGGLYAFDLQTSSAKTGFPTNYGVIAPALPLTNGSPVVLDAVDNDLDGYYVISANGTLWRVVFDGLNPPTITNLGDADGAAAGGKSAAPLILESGGSANIFFGLANKLYKVTYDGVSAPAAPTSSTLGGVLGDSTPLAGDGHIYVGSTDLKFYSINQAAPPVTATAVFTHTASLAGSGAFMDANTVVWPAQDGKQLVLTDGSGDSLSANNATGQWPLFQLNAIHTGTAGVGFSVSSVEQWAVLTAGDVRGPVVGDSSLWPAYPQGVAYFVAGTKLYALDVATHLIAKQWDLGATSGVSGYSSPAVIRVDNGANDEEWVFVADKLGVVRAYGFRWNGAAYEWVTNPTWSVDVGLDASKASVLAGFNDLVYVVEDAAIDRLHAINRANGSLLWNAPLGAGAGSSSPAFYDDLGNGVVYVGADKLYAVDGITGAVTPITLFTPAPGLVNSAPLIVGGKVYVLTSTARLFSVPVGGTVVDPPLITDPEILTTIGAASMATDGTYLFFGSGNRLWRYNTAGGVGALTSTPASGLGSLGTLVSNFTNSTPLVDSSGNVFIGGADGYLYGVDGDAVTMVQLTPAYNAVDGSGWPKKLGVGTAASSAAGSLAMDDGGNLYVPSLDDNLRRFGSAPAACTDCDLYTAAQWPMFQHDVTHSGRNGNGAGHRAPIALWSKATTTTSAPQRTPVLGPVKTGYASGILYHTAGQFVLARDAANGNELWRFDLGLLGNPSGGASPALMLAAPNGVGVDDDTVYVIVGAKDGFLYALNANTGAMVWRIDLGLDISKASPVIDGDGTIYVVEDTAVNDRLHAVYFNGTRKWTRDLAAGTGTSSPLLDVPNTNVIVGSANKVFAFDTASPTGASAWTTTMPAGTFNNTLVLSSDGDDLWALNSVGYLYRINPMTGLVVDGNPVTLAVDPIVIGVGAVGAGVAPAIQSDPYSPVGNSYDIIAFTAGTRLYRVVWNNTTNSVVTTLYWAYAGTLGNASPVIDANGWTYTLDSLGYLRAHYRYLYIAVVFAKKVATQGTIAGGPIIGNGTNGTAGVYVPSRNNTFYKVGKP